MKKILKTTLFFVISILIFSPGFAETSDHFVIGNEEGEGELINPRQVKEGPDGNIYVYDPMACYIKVYSPAGKFINKIGGKGEGPGEIKRTRDLRFGFTHNKKLFFTEFFGGHRWITIMNLDGSLNKTLNLQIRETFFGIGDLFFLRDGRFLVDLNYIGDPKKTKDYFLHTSPLKIFLVDAEGKILSKIKELDYFSRISLLPRGADMELPFIPASIWIPFTNNTIIFTDALSKNLQVLNYKGEPISQIKTTLPDCQKVTQKDLRAWRERRKEQYNVNQSSRGWYKKFGSVIEKYEKSIYDKKPNIGGLSLTPGNNILAGKYDPEKEESRYWLINQKGKTLLEIKIKAYSLIISKSFIFFKAGDEDDVINVHCLKRRGSEKEDLLRVTKLKL